MQKTINSIVLASNKLLEASQLLSEIYPDISDTVLLLADTLYHEIPEEDKQQIDIAMMDIELKREEYHVGC